MSSFTDQQRVANFMAALATLLCGKPGRHAEFIQKVELIVSGVEPNALQLMQVAPTLRATGHPLVWVHPTDNPNVPRVGLAALCGGQSFLIESCMLWMGPGDDRASLVPDAFTLGSFRFKNDLKPRYSRRAPAASFEEATAGMVRAYDRLLELQMKQRERGDFFELPVLRKAA